MFEIALNCPNDFYAYHRQCMIVNYLILKKVTEIYDVYLSKPVTTIGVKGTHIQCHPDVNN